MVTIKTTKMNSHKCESIIVNTLAGQGITATANFKTNIVTIARGSADIKKAKEIIRKLGY